MADLTTTDIRALEQCRRQLIQLTQTILSLHQAIQIAPTLPSLESLNIQQDLVKNNVKNILSLLNPENKDKPYISKQIVAYPSTNFPGRDPTKEEILRMLLRKKVEPDVEAWAAEGRKTGEESEGNGEEDGQDITVAWRDIKDWFDERVSQYAAEETGIFTAEEEARASENVNTGNKRDYEEHDDEDEDGDGERVVAKKMEDDVVGAEEKSLEDILRFWTTGQTEVRRQDNSHMHRRR